MAHQHQVQTAAQVNLSRLLTTPQAADKLSTSEQFLEADRCTRRHGIPFVRVGRAVRYRESDLDAWIERNTVGLAEAA